MPAMQIVGFETDEHMVTIRMSDMPKMAKTSNTKILIGGRPQGVPLSVEYSAQEILFDASNCQDDGQIIVDIYLPMGPASATSADEYHPTLRPDHEGADADAVTINTIRPTRARPGERVTVTGKNFARLQGIQIGFTKVGAPTKAGSSATFAVPTPFTAGRYPIKFTDANKGVSVTSRVFLEVLAVQGDGEG